MYRRLVSLTCVVAALVAGCSVEDGPVGEQAPTVTQATSTSAADTTAPTTTVALTSPATIEIGPAVYELDALCAAGGAGEIEVAVEGVDVNGRRVVGLIRAFLGEPYIGLQVGEGDDAVLFEPRLEGVLPFTVVDDVLEFAEVDFVTDLNLETGEFTPAGLGTVRVECTSFARELPDVVFD